MNCQRERAYRLIQPASLPGAAAGYRDAAPAKTALPKKRPVFRACHGCRRAKIKCDGIRPKCGPCHTKDRVCGYDAVEGVSQPQAITMTTKDATTPTTASASRLQALEMLIDVLQKSPSDQAARLLQRIRASDNPVAMLDALGEPSVVASSASSSNPLSIPPDIQNANDHLERWLRSQDPSDYSSVPGFSTAGSVLSEPDTSGSSLHRTSISSVCPDEVDMRCSLPPMAMNDTTTAAAADAHSLNLIQHAIPDPSITQEAVDVFFVCSGRLLHVFSREQGAQRYRAVFENGKTPADAPAVDIGCLMAIASVGAQYMCGSFGTETEESFYVISKHYLDAVIELAPLDAIKVCSLLAIYNVMGKATVSLAYVEIGLGLCRRFGLHRGSSPHPSFSEEAWIDYRKAWRTLMFLSSWLSTTLGYISGNDFHSDRVSLSELQVEDPRNTSDVVQTEISKICVLKANILRVHLAVNDITAPALQLIVDDLQDWYMELPGQMRLDCTGRDDLDQETKRSISHIHLHYLGAIMLLYSRITSQFMQPLSEWGAMPTALTALLEKLASEAVVAARTSSRVLWLMYEEHSIFKRCWLVIFQAYTSCLVLLHSAAQKQLHGFAAETLMEDIAYIKDSVAILYYCGEFDRVAASFHRQLTGVLDEILAKGASSRTQPAGADVPEVAMAEADSAEADPSEQPPSFAYLMTLPEQADGPHVRLSMSLLGMLCRPFGHPSSVIIGPAEVSNSLEEVVPRTRTWSRWGPEGNGANGFQWDLNILLSSCGATTASTDAAAAGAGGRDWSPSASSCGRFLGGYEPNGWIPAAPIREIVR